MILGQNAVDALASLMLTLKFLIHVDRTTMHHNSMLDQFVCRFWITDVPLWILLDSSTYTIVALSIERYTAVVYPVYHKVSDTGSTSM